MSLIASLNGAAATPVGSPPDAQAATAKDPRVAAAVELGWRMSELYRRSHHLDSDERSTPGHLGGLSSLSHCQRFELVLDMVEVALLQATDGIGWTTAFTAPSTNAVRAQLDQAKNAPNGQPDVVTSAQTLAARAIEVLHQDLICKLAAADPRLGKAYGLGRALADTCRAGQSQDDLNESFAPHRLGQLHAWLGDLASVLPDHAAKAVRQSLTWCRDYAYGTGYVTKSEHRQLLEQATTDCPGLAGVPSRSGATPKRVRIIETDPKAKPNANDQQQLKGRPDEELRKFVAGLGRQSEMWRVVLTGEKLAMHMLQPDDYVAAAQNTLTSAWKTVKSLPASLRAAAVTVLVVAIVGVGLIVGVSTASPGAKIGGTLGFLVAGLVSAGRLLKSAGRQLDPIVEKIKDPLWQTEVDYVVALALTRPPAGRPDSEAWDHFVDESQLQLTGQAQAPVNSPATG